MTPTATYRLQLRREFGFRAAADVVPYLADLGVSHVYCSPVLEATPGSAHGYDVIDHGRLSTELGGDAAWAELVAACRAHGLGLVVDLVPNHMAVPTPAELNEALWDVLRLGPGSSYASWFDVDWSQHGSPRRRGRLLMPVLGGPLGECLAAGEITVDGAAGTISYFDHRFPLAPDTSDLIADPAALLDAQHYRLAEWQLASSELNYRRFFDVTSLIGLRVEDPDVFTATHRRIRTLVESGEVDGLRIDHPDGLADPGGYLERLAAVTGPIWTVIEKILERTEQLPTSWPCAGTTGYDAIAALTRVLVDPAGEKPLTELYTSVTSVTADFDEVVVTAKRDVVDRLFGAEISRLARDAKAVPGASTFADDALRGAIGELLVAFDVYRSYAGEADSSTRIDHAASRAAAWNPQWAAEIGWVADRLHRRTDHPAAEPFAVRFEQTTGPVMAKGVEDTAFYRYYRLAALNEVGGDPGTFGGSVAQWHAHCERLARDWPAAMTTLSTHDTKRSEDVRARLFALAEMPVEWEQAVNRWRAAATRHGAPDTNADYLFWQTLVGAWPLTAERMADYLAKATREAKQHTSWTDPDAEYDARLRSYVEHVFADERLLADVADWIAEHVEQPGRANALAQKLLQLTMPGIPDVYQGQELTDRSLVDPDNRRPVDYDLRRAALARLDTGGSAAGQEKLRVTAATLRLRRAHPEPFAGRYEPVELAGSAADHGIAFRRSADDGPEVVVVVTRLPIGLRRRGGWHDTRLVTTLDSSWRDVLTGKPGTERLADLLAELPVALLVRDRG